MTLLLFLSALLSALTGVGGGAPMPEAAAISGRVLTVDRSIRAGISVTMRPTQSPPALPRMAVSRDTSTPVVDTPPLYEGRRRE